MISARFVTKEIWSYESNYIPDIHMWPKVDNCSNSDETVAILFEIKKLWRKK